MHASTSYLDISLPNSPGKDSDSEGEDLRTTRGGRDDVEQQRQQVPLLSPITPGHHHQHQSPSPSRIWRQIGGSIGGQLAIGAAGRRLSWGTFFKTAAVVGVCLAWTVISSVSVSSL